MGRAERRNLAGTGCCRVQRSEDHHRARPSIMARAASGGWSRSRLRWDILEAFAQAADQAGIPPVDDFNRGDNFGGSCAK